MDTNTKVHLTRHNALSLLVDLLKEHRGEAHVRLTPEGNLEIAACPEKTNGAQPPDVSSTQLSGKNLLQAALDVLHRIEPDTQGGIHRALRRLSEITRVEGLAQAWTYGFALDALAENTLRGWLARSHASLPPEVPTAPGPEKEQAVCLREDTEKASSP